VSVRDSSKWTFSRRVGVSWTHSSCRFLPSRLCLSLTLFQPSLFPRGLLTIVTGLREQYRHLSGQTGAADGSAAGAGRDETSHSSSLSLHQLLATSYCFCSLLLSIVQSPLSSPPPGAVTQAGSLQKSRFEAENEWSAVSNSLSLVCREEVSLP
jgi:hypothetical protein